MEDVKDKHEEILKENEECFRVLDWINDMNKQPIAYESVDKDGFSHHQRVQNEIKELYEDNKSLKDQLESSKAALEKARGANQDLKGKLNTFKNGDHSVLSLPQDNGNY